MNITRCGLLILCMLSFDAHAQGDLGTNRNYFKLCILNSDNEVLLVEHNNSWEFIGGEYNDSITIKDYIVKLAAASSVKVENVRLRGLFSVYVNKASKPFVYHYYSARYLSGAIKPPDDCTGVKWVDVDGARKLMSYKEMLWMYETILESNNVWGGSYRIIKNKAQGTRTVEKISEYYKLN